MSTNPTSELSGIVTELPPCTLSYEGIRDYIHGLGPRPSADAIINLAAHVTTQQMDKAEEQLGEYSLWKDSAGEVIGLTKVDGQKRRLRIAHGRDAWGCATHWHVEGSRFMGAISMVNRALTDITFRYSHRREQVRLVRPQPKHYYIATLLMGREQLANDKGPADGQDPQGHCAELPSSV